MCLLACFGDSVLIGSMLQFILLRINSALVALSYKQLAEVARVTLLRRCIPLM